MDYSLTISFSLFIFFFFLDFSYSWRFFSFQEFNMLSSNVKTQRKSQSNNNDIASKLSPKHPPNTWNIPVGPDGKAQTFGKSLIQKDDSEISEKHATYVLNKSQSTLSQVERSFLKEISVVVTRIVAREITLNVHSKIKTEPKPLCDGIGSDPEIYKNFSLAVLFDALQMDGHELELAINAGENGEY